MKVFCKPKPCSVSVISSAPCHSAPTPPPPIWRSIRLAAKLLLSAKVSLSNLLVSISGASSTLVR